MSKVRAHFASNDYILNYRSDNTVRSKCAVNAVCCNSLLLHNHKIFMSFTVEIQKFLDL